MYHIQTYREAVWRRIFIVFRIVAAMRSGTQAAGSYRATVPMPSLRTAFSRVFPVKTAAPPSQWDEPPLPGRPVGAGQSPSDEAILAALSGKIAAWWMPDVRLFVEALPHSAKGTILGIVP